MKVVLTTEAMNDLESIGDYIARDNPARARSFIAELTAKAHGIADLPTGFPPVQRYAHLGIRRRVHGRYLIFYRIKDQVISVIRILHSARDHEALLFLDD